MDPDIIHLGTISVDDVDSLIPEPGSTKASLLEDISFNGEVMDRELIRAGEVLTKVELDFACSSEKLVNLSVLMMHVAAREIDFESFASEKEPLADDSAEKAMEFDLLSGILDSEINELGNFLRSLQTEIQSVLHMISSLQHLGEAFLEIEEKLQDAENLLTQSQDQVLEMKTQSANFQRILSGMDGIGTCDDDQGAISPQDGDWTNMTAKIKMQTAEQQRHFLRMLEKSLAREMELEKKLTESRQTEEELRMKLFSAEQDVFYMEEEVEYSCLKCFEAENASEVLIGISKELLGKLQILQFNLNGSFKRENDLKSELVDSKEQLEAKEAALKKLETSRAREHDFFVAQAETLRASLKETNDKSVIFDSENFSLRERLTSLEERLKEQDSVSGAQTRESENFILELKEKLAEAETRAEAAETKCKLLSETNLRLDYELGLFKHKGFTVEKFELLEKQLKESDIQLEHAKATVEASQEKEHILYSTISDMDSLIKDLKMKVLKADHRADSAEDKLFTVSESYAELNDELGFLKGRFKCLEESLHQADETKMKTAKDIGARTKIMTNLVMQLAVERERLHKQISMLSMENSILMVKMKHIEKASSVVTDHGSGGDGNATLSPIHDQSAESCIKENSSRVAGPSAATSKSNDKKEESTCDTESDNIDAMSDLETVRRLDEGALGFKHAFFAILMVLISGLAYYSLQLNGGTI